MEDRELFKTRMFDKKSSNTCAEVLKEVYSALKTRGYNPRSQLVGYLVSDDPTYITNFDGARSLITEFTREELLREIVGFYIKGKLEKEDDGHK